MISCTGFLFSLLVGSCFAIKSATNEVPSKKDFLVEGLEDIEPAYASFEGKMYAGLLPTREFQKIAQLEEEGEDIGFYMFWLFLPDEMESIDSISVWFNGGPGCSSFHAGMMMENGPVTTPLHPAGYMMGEEESDEAPFIKNENAWTKVTTMLYVEQPAGPNGVGFSHGGREPVNETDVGQDFYEFLQNFFTVFVDQKYKRLFLVGESYAGYYVPGVAKYIHDQNKMNLFNGRPHRVLNLAGIALGNGWSDAVIQGPAVIDYAWWHGMIDTVMRDAFHAEWENCAKHIDNTQPPDKETEPAPFHSFTVPDECGIMGAILQAAGAGLLERGDPNTYDISTWDPYDILNKDDNVNVRFFNNAEVQEKLHVHPEGIHWMGCIPGAGRRRRLSTKFNKSKKMITLMKADSEGFDVASKSIRRNLHLLDYDRPLSMKGYLAELLDDAHIDILVYNGDRDMSTCSQGSELMLNSMNWTGHDAWLDPNLYERGLWLVDGEFKGYAKEVQNLKFLVVANSGHLVPYNVPEASLDLISRIVNHKSFSDKTIPVVFQVPKVENEGGESDGEAGHGRTFRAGSANKTRAKGETSTEETIILVLVAFTFGYATSFILAKCNLHCFKMGPKDGYEEIPRTPHGSTMRRGPSF